MVHPMPVPCDCECLSATTCIEAIILRPFAHKEIFSNPAAMNVDAMTQALYDYIFHLVHIDVGHALAVPFPQAVKEGKC